MKDRMPVSRAKASANYSLSEPCSPARKARKEGDATAALAGAAQKLEVIYEVPFQAHAAMEPLNCTADARADRVDVWAPVQFQTSSQPSLQNLRIETGKRLLSTPTFLGGGFGRKGAVDFVREAVEISKAAGAP